MEDACCVYILYSKHADRYYIGHSSDIARRLKEHNDPFVSSHKSKFCLKNGPWELVYIETSFKSRIEAMKREKQIKSWKSRIMIQKLIQNSTISSVGIPTCSRD